MTEQESAIYSFALFASSSENVDGPALIASAESRSRSRSPKTSHSDGTTLHVLEEKMGCMDITLAHSHGSAQRCPHCNFEVVDGWIDPNDDTLYCEYCWRCLKWFVPKEPRHMSSPSRVAGSVLSGPMPVIEKAPVSSPYEGESRFSE